MVNRSNIEHMIHLPYCINNVDYLYGLNLTVCSHERAEHERAKRERAERERVMACQSLITLN